MKQYTKEQIVEAISYWTRQLKLMTESYNNCVDALITEFGKDIVLMRHFRYKLTQQDLNRIFKILNQYIFNGEIRTIPVVLWPKNKLIDKINYHASESGVVDGDIDDIDCYGVHSAICNDILDENGNIIDVIIRDDYLMMNFDKFQNNCIFIFTVACICHEMIHVYDRQTSKEYHDLALKQSQTKKKQDFHKTGVFMNKKKEANDNGINVVDQVKLSHVESNISARYKLKNIIGEDEDSDTVVVKDDQMLYMKNKKTGKGVLVHFD